MSILKTNEERNFQSPKHISHEELLADQPTDYCIKHPEKKAKYLIKNLNETDRKLCSKCAIFEALKGGKLELDLSLLEKFKRDNLESLLLNLERNKKKSNVFQTDLKEKMSFLEITHNQQLYNLNKMFSTIQKALLEVQNEIFMKLDNNIQIMKNKIHTQIGFLTQFQEEINKIVNDISGNYQNIITEMKLDSFKGVFDLYKVKISTINDNILQIANGKYEYLIIEENSKQLQNFISIDLQKIYTIFKKSSFLNHQIQKDDINVHTPLDDKNDAFKNDASTECSSNINPTLTKNNSLHDGSRPSLFSNPSSLALNTKENSLCKSNQSCKKNIFTAEKTQKRTKNLSSTQVRMFVNSSPLGPNIENTEKVKNNCFITDRVFKNKHSNSRNMMSNYSGRLVDVFDYKAFKT